MKKIFDENLVKKNMKFIMLFIVLAIVIIIIQFIKAPNEFFNSELPDEDIDFSKLVINEVMTSNTGSYVDENGNNYDWIEIYNGTEKDVNLSNYGLSDDDSNIKWRFPNNTIVKSKDYLIVFLSGNKESGLHANFALSKDKEEYITLTSPKRKVVDSVKLEKLDKNVVMARDNNGDWITTLEITPGYSNNKDGREEYLNSLTREDDGITITEVLPKNKGLIKFDNSYDEYVEIQNNTEHDINIGDYFISNDINVPFKWKLPDIKLKSNQVYLIKQSDMNKDEETNFHLDNKNGHVILSYKQNIVQNLSYTNLTNGFAYIKVSDSYSNSINISPGYENTNEGIKKFNEEKRINNNDLIINEVMNYNDKYLMNNDKFYDWIELYNNTDKTISLGDYYITNDENTLDKFKLPDEKLNAGEYYILLASGDANLTGNYTHTNFKISSEEGIYLVKNNDIVDSIFVANVPLGYSYGKGIKTGLYYYSKPTPRERNDGDATTYISFEPIFSIKPGVYDNDKSLDVKLDGLGDIYYTLDGSTPNKDSNKYNGKIHIDKTTVIKAVVYEKDKKVSNVVTGTYFIGENHTLPLLSISLEDSNFNALYKDLGASLTVGAHAELYEKNNSFSVDCGIKLFGGQTRYIPKKSFALKFSSKYGVSKLRYKVFDNRDVEKYDTIVVRSGSQDSEGSMFRDELATSLMNDYGTIDVQGYKPVILYINGSYWGVYFLREKVDETFIGNHYENIDNSKTNIVRIDNVITTGSSKDYNELLSYINSHDMSKDSSYEWVSKHLDIDNYIDYLIGELYTTNNDIVNTRYFNNPGIDDGRIKMIFYDFDYAFYNVDRDYLGWLTKSGGMGEHHYDNTIIRGLMKNKTFKQRFLERLSYNMKNVWSDENVLKRYDELYNLIEPEMERNQKRWNSSYSSWQKECEILKNYIKNRRKNLQKNVKSYFELSDEEMKKYFE